MSTPDQEGPRDKPRKLREHVALPPITPAIKKALETTGRLPTAGMTYQMSDLLALAIHSRASDLHIRVGEPPLYRVDGRLIRAEAVPISSKQAMALITAFTGEDVIRIVREVGQADFGFGYRAAPVSGECIPAGRWGGGSRRIPEKIPTLEEILVPPSFREFAR